MLSRKNKIEIKDLNQIYANGNHALKDINLKIGTGIAALRRRERNLCITGHRRRASGSRKIKTARKVIRAV